MRVMATSLLAKPSVVTVGVLLLSLSSCVLERENGAGGDDGMWSSCGELVSSSVPPRPGDPCDEAAFDTCCAPDFTCDTWVERWTCPSGVLQRSVIRTDEDPALLRLWCGAELPERSLCPPPRGV